MNYNSLDLIRLTAQIDNSILAIYNRLFHSNANDRSFSLTINEFKELTPDEINDPRNRNHIVNVGPEKISAWHILFDQI